MFRLIRTALLRIVFEDHFRPAVGLRCLLVLTIVFRRSPQFITLLARRINLAGEVPAPLPEGVRTFVLICTVFVRNFARYGEQEIPEGQARGNTCGLGYKLPACLKLLYRVSQSTSFVS